MLFATFLFSVLPVVAVSMCPYKDSHDRRGLQGLLRNPHAQFQTQSTLSKEAHRRALQEVSMTVVKDDVIAMLTDSKEFWPADFGKCGSGLGKDLSNSIESSLKPLN